MIRNPVLRDRPMGVTQKYLIVTSNYAARAVGVTKLMGITEAKQKCPDLVLVNGEDLTPYRQASKRIMAVLQRFGVAERGGMDEVFVDVSQEVQSRLAKGVAEPGWCGHVHSGKDALVADNKHRPMDLRVDSRAGAPGQYAAAGPGDAAAWEAMLKVGSAIAAEARAAVKAEAGFRSSAGIACNRMLAKMAFGERTAAFLFAGCRGLDSTPVQASGPPKSITVEDSFKSCNSHAAACQVERLDDPSLVERPLVVQQFNAGGFVAVSYEARAAGVRCGDGVGAGGRSNIKWLQEVGAVSMEEAKRRCPGLVVRPMRTERYRQVAGQVHDLLRRFTPAGLVEKASYDDFYLDVSAHCQAGPLVHADADGQAPAGLQVVAGLPWEQLGPSLQKGAQIAVEVRHALKAELGLTASCGLAHNKLLARLAGPLHKPDGCTALPHSAACEFIHGFRIKDIPNFRAKLGDEVTAKLGIETVGELAGFEASHMARLFGPQTGETLAGLALGLDPSPVRDRGPPKSLTCERSFPPLTTQEAVRAALEPLAASLWSRLLEDLGVHGRLPTKLTLAVRQGYNAVQPQ
ncbi:hypothetical protein WJX72_011771 [[Myrmecia] bisecta]|uniref:UmuC domain-containing protein n=1 Tax=[Myrmecia] bisecta TaxID=41462 RepID=A0AAW1PD87_9CHLO